MYKSIYLLQMRWRLKHNGIIMRAYGIRMACYSVHGPQRKEWGIRSISGAAWRIGGYTAMLQPVYWYLGMFYKVLQYSTMSDDYATGSDDMEGMYGGHMMRHMIREYEGK